MKEPLEQKEYIENCCDKANLPTSTLVDKTQHVVNTLTLGESTQEYVFLPDAISSWKEICSPLINEGDKEEEIDISTNIRNRPQQPLLGSMFEKTSKFVWERYTYSTMKTISVYSLVVILAEATSIRFLWGLDISLLFYWSITATLLGIFWISLYEINLSNHWIIVLDRKNGNIEFHTSRNIGKLYVDAWENMPPGFSMETYKEEVTRLLLAERKNILCEIKERIISGELRGFKTLSSQSHLLNTPEKIEAFKDMIREIFWKDTEITDLPPRKPDFLEKFWIWAYAPLIKLAMCIKNNKWAQWMLSNRYISEILHFFCGVGNLCTKKGRAKVMWEKREFHGLSVNLPR